MSRSRMTRRNGIAAPGRAVYGGAALCLVLLCAAAPAWSARWFDKLPADDPDTVPPQQTVPLRAAPAPSAGGGGVLTGVYNLAAGVVSSVQTVAAGTREAWWEATYMFGMNSTPVPRTAFHDPVADMMQATEEPPPAPALTAAPRLASAAPEQAPAAPAVVPAATTADSPAVLPAIDPGLLANFFYERGVRRPDGSYFVPKPLQRLFEMRTRRVAATEMPIAVSFAGRIVPDPQNRGEVETSLMGRIEPPDAGLPVIGQAVRKGEILGYVVPAVGVVDRTQVRREVARLTTDIRVETENLEILRQFSFVPFRDGKIYQSEQRISGLRREREALLPLLQTREVLRASADGVISTSAAIAGRIVQPGTSVFTIVNPDRLWVEAFAPDPTIAANAASVQQANANTPEGQNLALTFVGSGLALREQSVPLLFRIDSPTVGLRVGRLVTVSVLSNKRLQRGMPVAREALTIGADGVQEVWEQSEPEIFVPHAVRTVDVDGSSVLIVDGLKDGARVVVSGVRLLAQLQ